MKILISGYYGFGNLGDEALLRGIVSTLKSAGHSVTVLSSNPTRTREMHGVASVHRTKAALSALLQTEVLISGGGGLLQDKTSFRSLRYYLMLIRLAKLLRKKVIVYAQSVGPLSERGQRAVARTLSGVEVAVRDSLSQQLLGSLNIPSHLVADAALLLESDVTYEATGRVLLIPRAGYQGITEALGYTAKTLLARGVSVAATAVQPDEDGGALEEMRRAAPGLELLSAATPEDLLSHIGSSGYVISGRLHGLVLAAAAGVDFSGLVYDPKVAAFLSEAQAPAFSLPVDKARLARCALSRPAVPAHAVQALRQRARSGAAWLLEQLVL